ncbi:adenylyl-sulfate kinase [Candidatus Pacearchaeota archaeon]|nr:adenylyl-sulfate kinase [Candidatus Pacearchaeota archaeon]
MQKKGRLVWITGLAGSGKTTLAKRLQEEMDYKPVHLDGDNIREILDETTTHGIDGRQRTAKIYSKLCSYLTNQGHDVIMSTISLFHDIHDYNKEHNKNYYEVLLQVDPDILRQRDKKDLYTTADGNVMGLHQTPEFPKNPTLVLTNNNEEEIDQNVQAIIKVLNNGKA